MIRELLENAKLKLRPVGLLDDDRGKKGLLWKGDFARLFLDRFPDLERVREERIPYLNAQGNEDVMYLLRKQTVSRHA